ncbi:MAG TPA: hypothetical protein VK421_07220 [Pyrinomonadaceae bacterium]|nr:hypothetical protein [Pyrinomonadaceae bacterium]
MSRVVEEPQTYVVVGQKYAYATASLILGLACFVNLAGMEKAALAVAFAWLALRRTPPPALEQRRLWAQAGLALGGAVLIIVPTIIIIYFDRLRDLLELIVRLGEGR